MDLLSKYSPSSSVSPPISPIKLFNQPSTSLPPLKNLPVWNRPGLEKNRFIRSITKDSQELEKTEILFGHLTSKGTQTSPPGTAINSAFQLSGKEPEISKDGNDENPAIIAEKRLYFVQSEHDHVLKKLHTEIEKLKKEKKELNFKFVMTKNGISISPDNKDDPLVATRVGSSKVFRKTSQIRKNSGAKQADRGRDNSAKEEKNRRANFKSGGSRNPVLESKQLHRMKSGSKSAKYPLADQTKKIFPDQQQSLKLDDSAFQSLNNIQKEKGIGNVLTDRPSREVAASAVLPVNDKKYSSDDYEDIIRGLQRMNARQANELNHLRDKLIEQQGKPAQEEPHMHPDNRLPKLAIRSTTKSARMPPVLGEKHEILTLPALRPQKLGNRQRKAQATHLQRQRVNKEFVQKFA